MSAFNKASMVNGLLDEGYVVSVFVRTDIEGVVLPEGLEGDGGVVKLDISHHFPVPMRGYATDEEKLEVTLSFNRTPFHCIVPWASVGSVVVISGKRGVSLNWFDELPPPRPKPKLQLV